MRLNVRFSEPSPVRSPTCQNRGGSDRSRQDHGSSSSPQTHRGTPASGLAPGHLPDRLWQGRAEQKEESLCACRGRFPSPLSRSLGHHGFSFPWDLKS